MPCQKGAVEALWSLISRVVFGIAFGLPIVDANASVRRRRRLPERSRSRRWADCRAGATLKGCRQVLAADLLVEASEGFRSFVRKLEPIGAIYAGGMFENRSLNESHDERGAVQ